MPTQQSMTIQDWLHEIEKQHPDDINFGLDRIDSVARAIGEQFYQQIKSPQNKVVTIGGTNGKGTTIAIIEALSLAAEKTVFSYTSPHLIAFNERFRINGEAISDADLAVAFSTVEAARGDTKLTFFEFTTLAAFVIAQSLPFDILLFEIGLGGRLDAVNLIEPDIAVITSIALDHTEWLGHSLAEIAAEKFAIARKRKKLVIADNSLPIAVRNIALKTSAECVFLGNEFQFYEQDNVIVVKINPKQHLNPRECASYKFKANRSIHNNNLAGAVYVAYLLNLELSKHVIFEAQKNVFIPGRFEKIAEHPTVFVDVSHNEQAIATLADRIKLLHTPVTLICGMLKDKDIQRALLPLIAAQYQWLVCDLPGKRGADADFIRQNLPSTEKVKCVQDVKSALKLALAQSSSCGTIVVFGSFVTAEAAKRFFQSAQHE